MDLGLDAIEGIEFINGQVFLERFYSIFGQSACRTVRAAIHWTLCFTDTSNRRVGLATTQYTNAETN